MQGNSLIGYIAAVSEDRLRVYGPPSRPDVHARYLWNQQLCEAFYPVLQAVEVGLRNGVSLAFTSRYGRHWLTGREVPFNSYQSHQIERSQRNLEGHGQSTSRSRMLGQLPFGFWVSTFDKHLDRTWRGLEVVAFPHAPRAQRRIPVIRETLDDIRQFRNRVFHHERILHRGPSRVHKECREIIGWLSPHLLAAVDAIDRFPEVQRSGLKACHAIVTEAAPWATTSAR